jgi:antitoxin VapB
MSLDLRACGRFEKPHDIQPGISYFYHLQGLFYQGETMGAQLNIKSDDAYRLASRLSELTGESLTTVVTKALRTELDREQRIRDKATLRARLLALADEISADMPADVTSDHNWLYDEETGLPR